MKWVLQEITLRSYDDNNRALSAQTLWLSKTNTQAQRPYILKCQVRLTIGADAQFGNLGLEVTDKPVIFEQGNTSPKSVKFGESIYDAVTPAALLEGVPLDLEEHLLNVVRRKALRKEMRLNCADWEVS
ncbi:hypothetical protein [Aliagarivorans taiwanensis]|uniref:hypothetical protein n=1 Tax=Aliagarivorans taiwanensis TaxID=561966 RepID=UPI0004014183|nr:hypothetical protein [Aliagarivorans taiwanensis]